MTISRKTAGLLVILTILTAMPLAAWHGGNAALAPEKTSERLATYYLGQAVLGLPESFQLDAGRLRLICEGSTELTAVAEIPYRGQGPLSPESMAALIPESGRHYPVKDLSAELKRPARLFFSNPGPSGVLASVIVDYGQGALRLSRLIKRDLTGSFAVEDFEMEARRYARNYLWGHNGSRPGDMHSLYGRLSSDQGCRDYRARLKFSSSQHSVKVLLVNDRSRDLAALAAENGLALALPGGALEPPTWLTKLRLLKSGLWSRQVRGGPRQVAGRPGLEWVTLSHNLTSGEKTIAALWLPEARPSDSPAASVPVMMMSAAEHDAGKALRYWDDLLGSSAILADL